MNIKRQSIVIHEVPTSRLKVLFNWI